MPDSNYCGILNINKPPEMTSRRVVDVVQRLVRPAKAGHGGTLDPLATGVLVVCVGSATRLITHVQQGRKAYRAEFLLGQTSNTDDVTGEVVPVENPIPPTCEEIAAGLQKYVGEIDQIPPQFSAVHVNGKRAYQLARAGEAVELKSRRIHVHGIERIDYQYPLLTLEIECGSGTYIRSIGRDLGTDLGCGAVMSGLIRTRVGPFSLESASELETLTAESLPKAILPPITAVPHLPRYCCSAEELQNISYGRPIHPTSVPPTPVPEDIADGPIALVTPTGDLAAIATYQQGSFAPKQVFPS